jgi:hypothetical protein
MDKFMPKRQYQVHGLGNPDSDILILIDHPDSAGMKGSKVFGPQVMGVYQNCLHQADLITNSCYLLPIVPDCPTPKMWWTGANTKRPKQDTTRVKEYISQILDTHKANMIVAMGDLSAYLLTGSRNLSKERGYQFPCIVEGHEERKVIPVQDVKGMVWRNDIWRYYLSSDLQKAKEHSKTPELQYDERLPIVLDQFEIALEILVNMRNHCVTTDTPVSVDIEVSNFQISHVGFATETLRGYSVPFHKDVWTEEQEVRLWIEVAKIMGDERITKIGQNFIFDIHFMLTTNSIITRGKIIDTMVLQAIYFPDFLKGLGFLASTYINVPSWKDMVKHTSMKEND